MKRKYPLTPAEENPFAHTINRLAPMEQKKSIFLDWLKIPQPKRVPRNPKDLAKSLGIEPQVIDEWTAEVKIKEQKVETYNSKEFFNSKRKEIDAGMVKAVGRGNAQMAKLIKQLTGELVEKQEVTHKGFTADDIDKINKKADAELEEFYRSIQTGGIQEVQEESSLLPD